MINFYIEDPNGTHFSEDGSRSFIKMTNGEAYNYLNTPQGKVKRFYRLYNPELSKNEPCYDYIEIPEQRITEFRSEENHDLYLSQWHRISGINFVSLEQEEAMSEEGSGARHCFASGSDVHAEVASKLELQQLTKALSTLNNEDRYILQRLYFSDPPATLQEVGREIGVSVMTVQRSKIAILKKLKKFL